MAWEGATGRPVHRAIVWQDRRTAGMCRRLEESGAAQVFRDRTGLLVDAYFSGTKIAWLLDQVDGLRKRAGAGEIMMGTIDSWLVYKLTGGRLHITDCTNASRTLFMDLARVSWDDELLGILNVPRDVLPEIRPSSQLYGETDRGELQRTRRTQRRYEPRMSADQRDDLHARWREAVERAGRWAREEA